MIQKVFCQITGIPEDGIVSIEDKQHYDGTGKTRVHTEIYVTYKQNGYTRRRVYAERIGASGVEYEMLDELVESAPLYHKWKANADGIIECTECHATRGYKNEDEMCRVVIGVDPATTGNDKTVITGRIDKGAYVDALTRAYESEEFKKRYLGQFPPAPEFKEVKPNGIEEKEALCRPKKSFLDRFRKWR